MSGVVSTLGNRSKCISFMRFYRKKWMHFTDLFFVLNPFSNNDEEHCQTMTETLSKSKTHSSLKIVCVSEFCVERLGLVFENFNKSTIFRLWYPSYFFINLYLVHPKRFHWFIVKYNYYLNVIIGTTNV